MSSRVLVAAVALATVLVGCGSRPEGQQSKGRPTVVGGAPDRPRPAKPRSAVRVPGGPGSTRGQDPQDTDPRLRRRERQALREHPLIQLLPVTTRHLAVDLTGTTRDGRIALLVRTDLTPHYARRAYQRLLARHRDSGAGYVPTFRTV